MQGLLHFGHLSYYTILLEENNRIHHFYCQTKRMLTWEILAALVNKGKDTQAVLPQVPAGSSLIINQLNLRCGRGTSLKGMLYQAHRAAQHRRGPARVNWQVHHQLLHVQCSSGHAPRPILRCRQSPTQSPSTPLQPARHCGVLALGWGLLALPVWIQTIKALEVRARKMFPVKIANCEICICTAKGEVRLRFSHWNAKSW